MKAIKLINKSVMAATIAAVICCCAAHAQHIGHDAGMHGSAEMSGGGRQGSELLSRYVQIARERLKEDRLEEAKYYYSRAEDISSSDEKVKSLANTINKHERIRELKDQEERVKKLALSEDERDNILEMYDTSDKTWFDHFKDVFSRTQASKRPVKIFPGERYTIEECVEIAKRSSFRLKMADRQMELARWRLLEARRDLFPEVTLRYEFSEGQIFEHDEPVDYEGQKWAIELKQNLFDGFATWYEVKQAEINQEIMELERQKIINEIIEETQRAYYLMDKALKNLELQKEVNRIFNENYELIQEMNDRELVARSEYLKVKSLKLQSDFDFTSAEEDFRLAEIMLLHAMNMDQYENIQIEPVPRAEESLSIGLDNCYQLAYTHRPDIIIKARVLEYHSLEKKINRRKGWPQIDFHGSFGQSYERPTSGMEDDDERIGRGFDTEWFAGATARVPFWGSTLEYRHVREEWQPSISTFRGTSSNTSYFNFYLFDDLNYFSELEDSKVRLENAKFEYLKEKEDATVEIKGLYFKYRRSLVLRELSTAKIENQKAQLAILKQRMEYDELEISNFLEEVDKLASEKYGRLEADTNYYISLAELNRSIGLPGHFEPKAPVLRSFLED